MSEVLISHPEEVASETIKRIGLMTRLRGVACRSLLAVAPVGVGTGSSTARTIIT